MKRIIFCTLVLVMFFLNSVYLNAQIQKTLGMDGGFYFNSSNIAYHFSLTYSLQFNQYFGISAGTMFLSVPLDIAGFVVRENYKHHSNSRPNIHFDAEVEAVYREEVRYFNHSRIFVAKNSENNIIGAIRLMLWDGRETLPIQSLFGIQCLNDISPDDSCSAIWHIGRLAVNTDIGRHGLLLFKSLLLYAMYPICNRKKGIVFAECDSKLLRTMKLMGIRVHSLGNGIEYLGSETIPVYSTYDDLVGFFRENQSFYGINQASVVA
jgi:hypothetical protein